MSENVVRFFRRVAASAAAAASAVALAAVGDSSSK